MLARSHMLGGVLDQLGRAHRALDSPARKRSLTRRGRGWRTRARRRAGLRRSISGAADRRPACQRAGAVAAGADAGPDWYIRHVLNLIAVPLLLVLLLPLLIVVAPFFLFVLRARETSDPVITPRPDPARVATLAAIEDFDVTNQFSAFGSVKPGWFRLGRWSPSSGCWTSVPADLYAWPTGARRHNPLRSMGILDDRRRLLFASNYDGSLDSYMDDFINKVAYGLNLVFSNGIGYPRTEFMLSGGAKHEMTVQRPTFAAIRCRRRSGTRPTLGFQPPTSRATRMIREGLGAHVDDRSRGSDAGWR